MHAAVAQQSEKMQLLRTPALHRLLEKRHARQLFVGDQQINSSNVHVHDPPRAHVHVPHFAVAHLSFGQSYKWPRGMNQSIWKLRDQFVVRMFPRQSDGVSLGLRGVSPSSAPRPTPMNAATSMDMIIG